MKPKEISKCPICGEVGIKLLFRDFLQTKYWYYKCTKCDSQFTTTESDIISLSNLKEFDKSDNNVQLPIRYCQHCGELLNKNKHKIWCELYCNNVR